MFPIQCCLVENLQSTAMYMMKLTTLLEKFLSKGRGEDSLKVTQTSDQAMSPSVDN